MPCWVFLFAEMTCCYIGAIYLVLCLFVGKQKKSEPQLCHWQGFVQWLQCAQQDGEWVGDLNCVPGRPSITFPVVEFVGMSWIDNMQAAYIYHLCSPWIRSTIVCYLMVEYCFQTLILTRWTPTYILASFPGHPPPPPPIEWTGNEANLYIRLLLIYQLGPPTCIYRTLLLFISDPPT